MEYKYLRHAQVVLDSENPRLPDGTSSDKEAINRLLEDGPDQLVALAKDLVETGEANPAELPIMMKVGKKYTALEGNRRFAALKLLEDPRLADDPEIRKTFTRIAKKGTGPSRVYCVIAPDRETADHWIMLRHTGANNGVSPKRWSPEQTATHRRRMNASVDSGTVRSLTIAHELTEAYHADPDLIALITKIRTTRLTNIGRLFSLDVLQRMHLSVQRAPGTGTQEWTLWARHTTEELHGFFVWAFNELDTKTVDAFKNGQLRAELLNSAASVMPDPSTVLSTPIRLATRPFVDPEAAATDDEEEDTEQDGSATGNGGSEDASGDADGSDGNSGSSGSGSSGSGGGSGAKPEKVVYSAVKLSKLPSPVQKLLKEAQKVELDGSPHVALILVRVLLEVTVSTPDVLSWSGAKEGDSLAKKTRACLTALDPHIDHPVKRTRKDLAQAFLEVDQIGIQYLHQFVHNSMATADHHLARRFSAAFTPLLNSINDSV